MKERKVTSTPIHLIGIVAKRLGKSPLQAKSINDLKCYMRCNSKGINTDGKDADKGEGVNTDSKGKGTNTNNKGKSASINNKDEGIYNSDKLYNMKKKTGI
ncbi:hypothetical protein RclHR1_22530001 [Rhizophagus clarus]|uniref:Uncharacterized protein n=1 Tax=Rhizophagus clarus TaxID=94130 RepID=A0A2Z6RNT6_9GLOM|nr:hypothetical protein RclHR1_22530001 [Rhizophagus clarus]GES72522.1 hypothetical protein RCL_jg25266.t1 [Rhizophagus clarus]